MPTYEYECSSCRHSFELSQHMSDAPIEACPECGGRLRKVFHTFGMSVKSGRPQTGQSPCAEGGCPFAAQCGRS